MLHLLPHLTTPATLQDYPHLKEEEMEAREDEVLWLTIWYKFSIYFVYKCVILIKQQCVQNYVTKKVDLQHFSLSEVFHLTFLNKY